MQITTWQQVPAVMGAHIKGPRAVHLSTRAGTASVHNSNLSLLNSCMQLQAIMFCLGSNGI